MARVELLALAPVTLVPLRFMFASTLGQANPHLSDTNPAPENHTSSVCSTSVQAWLAVLER